MCSTRHLLRALVLALALSVVSVAAIAPRLRADGVPDRGAAQPLWATYPTCTMPLVNTGWDSRVTLPPYAGIAQPFGFTANVAACSLKVDPSYTFGRLEVVQWDAANLLPDPTTVALRSVALNSSNMAWNWLHVQMTPPLVTRAIAHVAGAPSASGALTYVGTYPYNSTSFRYTADGDPALPAGFYATGSGYHALAGAHPVHGLTLCGGDVGLQDLRVVQSVMATDTRLDWSRHDVLQRFRVPRRVRLHWVEFAYDSTATWYSFGSVSILRDGLAGASPPLELPPPLLSATFSASYETSPPSPAWHSHFDFDSSLVLEPDVDYWLLVTPANQFQLRAHALTGGEGADFTAGIGPMWSRNTNGQPWTLENARALSFRVIGDTASVVSVDDAPRRSPLELRATPNPSRGASMLAWSGATGRVKLEVLDARGRRVSDDVTLPAASGRWAWSATRSGRPLPAGLYFVRATDSEGRAAIA
ncbi:MAG: T9SS type A sorting domain-containing protein, partial [Candidatus Eisenbacteria bacterium]|nr:T9SS type A sorting domain-containing protein [Candidatus Eisenbacteria bacterium]